MKTNCLKCKKEFKTYPSKIKKGKHQYCSMDCRKTTITRECQICHQKFSIPSWLSTIKKTCSKKCGYGLMKQKYQQARIERNQSRCIGCLEDFISGNGSYGAYCSRSCYWNFRPRLEKPRCIDCGSQVSRVKSVKRCGKCNGKSKMGENHPRWNGGNKCRDIHSLFNPLYVEWRTSVFTRDDYKCKIADEDCGGQLEAHHILRWSEYPKLRYQVNNGITLCHAHHPRKRAEEKRLTPYFKELVSVSNE